MWADRRPRRLSLLLCLAPVVALVVLAWSRRWTADDGFINLRIVQQVLAGHGPVFNPGERVEAGTSTLWVAALVVASRLFWFVRLEWVAVFLGLLLGVVALLLAFGGARALHRGSGVDRAQVWLPAGLVVLVALPPVWDFTTSGLEVSLSFTWLALCFWLLVKAPERPWLTAVVIGLGPLVRPDFAIYSAAFLVALVVLERPDWRRGALLGGAAVGLPALYELFRAAYYAALVPNTAFAKEASRARWGQGLTYVGDFVGPYWLWLALVVLAVLLALLFLRGGAVERWVGGACVAGGVVHGLYIVRVGGDFMHGRMLLPPLFALALPVAVVPLERARAVALALVPWALFAAQARPAYGADGFGPRYIANERKVYSVAAGETHPVTTDDYRTFWVRYAKIVRSVDATGPRLFLDEEAFEAKPDDRHRLPLRHPGHSVVVFRYVGMLSYASGADVRVDDLHGLADPIGSRLVLGKRLRPGHEKLLDLSWPVARYASLRVRFPDDPQLEARAIAARDAINCGPIKRLLDAVSKPLTLGRAASNVRYALTNYGARFGNDPVAARAAYCRSSGGSRP
jgi:arabinofuranosyltransferase